MKKLLLSLLVLVSVAPLLAERKFDEGTQKFYSIPSSSYVDQEEYHFLNMKVGSIIEQHRISKGISLNNLRFNEAFAKEVRDRILLYLVTIGTPTAERVLMDIFKEKFLGQNL